MLNRPFVSYLVVAGLIVLLSVCYIGYREYQKQVEFEAFMSKVRTTVDKETHPPDKMESVSQGTNTGVSVASTRHRIDVSIPPIQVSVMSKEEEAEVKPIDWSEVPPETRAKLEKLGNAPMTLQRIQTPNGNVHFIELPAGINYNEVEITVSEEMASQPTFPPTGSFDEVVLVRKSEIPEGEDIEEYTYKKRWALFLGVSVEEVGKQIERGHLPPRPTITERTPVIEFPIDELIGDDNRSGSGGSVAEARRSGEYQAEAPVSDGELSEDTQRDPVPVDVPHPPSNLSGVLEPSHRSMTGRAETKTPTPPTTERIETQLRKQLSPERFDKAQQLIDEYGREEGMRRLREMDPEAARQFEQEHLRSERLRPAEPSRDAPDGKESER